MSNFNYTTEIEMSTLNEDQRGNLSSKTNATHFSLPITGKSDENGYKKTENTQKKWEKNRISKCDNMWMPQENVCIILCGFLLYKFVFEGIC